MCCQRQNIGLTPPLDCQNSNSLGQAKCFGSRLLPAVGSHQQTRDEAPRRLLLQQRSAAGSRGAREPAHRVCAGHVPSTRGVVGNVLGKEPA